MIRIVVADDEYIVMQGMQAIFKRLNAPCEIVGSAQNGIDALEVIREVKPDLVITDIRMPGLDGLSLIESCREFLPEAAYVVISGYTEFEYARRALELNVISYVDKPVTVKKIAEVLKLFEKRNNPVPSTRRELDEKTSELVKLALSEDYSQMEEVLQEILNLLEQGTVNFDAYRQEVFKLLAVIAEIYQEQNRQSAHPISYQEFDKLAGYEEIRIFADAFARRISEDFCGKKVGSRHRVIKQLLQSIEESYGKDIGLNEFALSVGMNPAYLSILFREEVGVSYVKYLTDFRMKKAKEFLEKGMKVVEVSYKVGYGNYRYFCDIFKRKFGKTPSQYKGSVRKKANNHKNI